MTGNPLSQNPRITRLIHAIQHSGVFHAVRERDEDDFTSVNIVCSHPFSNIGVDAEELAAHLLDNGYRFVDPLYLENGLIHAKFDNEFDIWVDCRDPVEPYRQLVADFSADFIFDEWTFGERDLDCLVQDFNQRILAAMRAFELSLQGFHTRPARFGQGHRHTLATELHLLPE